jgi:hypothetical protein
MVMRKALPAAEEVVAYSEAVKEIPVEEVVEKEVVVERKVVKEAPIEGVIKEEPVETVVVEKEVVVEREVVAEAPAAMELVKEVQVEKEAEEPVLLTAPVLRAEKAATPLPAATPAPPTGIAESGDLEAKPVAPLVEQAPKEEIQQELVIPMTPPAERAPDRVLDPAESRAEVGQEAPAGTSTVVSAIATSTRALPTPTPSLPQRVVDKAVPSPWSAPLPPAAAVAEAVEPTRSPHPPRRFAVRLIEYVLGLLVVVLAGSTLVLRLRHR